MSAEAIASVVADLRNGRVHPMRPPGVPVDNADRAFELALGMVRQPTIVDATKIYEALLERSDPIALYEDHPCIAPPWDEAAICYVNRHGNVIVLHVVVMDDDLRTLIWEPAEPVDTDRLKWHLEISVWLGGRGGNGPMKTTGPAHMWDFAIYSDGEPADMHWHQLMPETDLSTWDNANLVLLGSLNFMNCRNVELVEPIRSRAERRRLERLGETVRVINVKPVGRSSRGVGAGDGASIPLHPVRGHYAHYGACCASHEPKGLLFGKLTGRYWIPQFARGDVNAGELEHSYKLQPG